MKEADISWKERCKILLEILNRSKDSVEIRKPVSILDVPDYLEFVDHPMDLQTVWQQMQDGHYATPKDFAKDVRLIFQNAKNYYKNKESKVYGMTFRLSLLCEDYIRHILFCYKHRNTSAQSKLSKTDERMFFRRLTIILIIINNFSYMAILTHFFLRAGMEETNEEMGCNGTSYDNGSLVMQPHNDIPQSPDDGMRPKQPSDCQQLDGNLQLRFGRS